MHIVVAFFISKGVRLKYHGYKSMFTCSIYLNLEFSRSISQISNILSGRIGKVVARHAKGCRVDSRQRLYRFILYTRRSGDTAHEGGWYDQSIRSNVSDAIFRSWLWLTATGDAHWDTSGDLLQVVDN